MRELSFLAGFAISLVDDEVMQSQVPTTLQVIKKQNREKKKVFECIYFRQIGILSTCSRGNNYQVNVRRKLGNEYPPIICRLMALCNSCFKVDRWNARVCVRGGMAIFLHAYFACSLYWGLPLLSMDNIHAPWL